MGFLVAIGASAEFIGAEVIAVEVWGREFRAGVVAFENETVFWEGSGLQEALVEDVQSDRVEMAIHADEGQKSAGWKQIEDVVQNLVFRGEGVSVSGFDAWR